MLPIGVLQTCHQPTWTPGDGCGDGIGSSRLGTPIPIITNSTNTLKAVFIIVPPSNLSFTAKIPGHKITGESRKI
jgi:hypothetical protein